MVWCVVQRYPDIKSPGDRVRPAFQNIGDYIGSITVDHRVGWQGSHRPHGGRVHPRATGIAHTLQIGFMSRSEEHTSELQSLMRISYAVFCLKKKNTQHKRTTNTQSSLITTKAY